MIKKLSLILIVLFAVGTLYAADINDLQVPSDFSGKKSDGNYFMPKTYDNPRFIISEFNQSSDYFKNTSIYEFWPSNETNIFCFSNHQASDMGAAELIQVDGKKYTVSVLYASTIIDEDYMNDSIKYLQEFNKLNNITPIKP